MNTAIRSEMLGFKAEEHVFDGGSFHLLLNGHGKTHCLMKPCRHGNGKYTIYRIHCWFLHEKSCLQGDFPLFFLFDDTGGYLQNSTETKSLGVTQVIFSILRVYDDATRFNGDLMVI